MAASDFVPSSRRDPRRLIALAQARAALVIAAQIAVLWLMNLGASTGAALLHLPVPGNVLGLVLLFALVWSGILKAAWLEPAATLLVKHLAFFFIPITVGLKDMGPLFALHGIGILFILTMSAAVGMAVCGLTSTRLMNVRSTSTARPESASGV